MPEPASRRTDDEPLRVAIVGYGLGGSTFHAPIVAAVPGLRVAAVVTRDPERSRHAAHDHPEAAVVPTTDALLARAGADDLALDLVVVTTPNRTHAPIATAALDAGLPVVVDKPFATTAAEGRALAAHARERGLLLSVFQNRRWDADFLTLRRLITEGTLGRVLRFESRFERWRPVPKGGWRESGAPEDAGGTLYDLGSHLIDQALVLFGPVTRVYAELARQRAGVEADDDVFLALTHASGTRSHLHMGALVAQPGPRFRAMGTLAGFVKEGMDPQEAALRNGARPDDPGFGEEPPLAWGTVGTGDELRRQRSLPGDWCAFYAGVERALRQGTPPPVLPDEAIATLAIIEAARISAAEEAVVAL